MSKIFRLHTGANNTIKDWTDVNTHISETDINTIKDPAGATDKEKITSIPSPFASIDLVRTAFKWINEHNQLQGTTMYHKLVSDCLDVAEIFFNFNTLKRKVELISWDAGISILNGNIMIDPNSDLGSMINSDNLHHKLLGETFKLYLSQDGKAYNFEKLKRIYLLNYIGEGSRDELNIIGGTSPATMFFASSNDLSYVDISFGTHKVFSDKSYCTLFERSDDFIKYIFSLRKYIPNFSTIFREFDEYLMATIGHQSISQSLRIQLNSIAETPNYYQDNYSDINIGAAGNQVEILGFPLKTDNFHTDRIEKNSAFVISTNKPLPSPLPLVLPNSSFTQPLVYTTQPWVNANRAPYHDEISFDRINARTLPHQAQEYPYLTIDDLFEPYLIRTIYPINKEKYFDGNLKIEAGESGKGYTLPLKENFFRYFSTEELQNYMNDGKPMVEIVQKSSTKVEVTLRIPIRSVSEVKATAGGIITKHYITYIRVYEGSPTLVNIQQPDIINNKGVILENQFAVTVYPFLKSGNDLKSDYRVVLIDRNITPLTKSKKYDLSFFKDSGGQPFGHVAKKIRSDKNLGDEATSYYYILNKEFDYLQLFSGTEKGIIIPKFKIIPPGTSQFTFAVDFGTTNTHIEYRINGGQPKPFEINENDEQFAALYSPNLDYNDLTGSTYNASIIPRIMEQEFMPLQISKDKEHKFPQRTVIANNRHLNLNQAIFSAADMSIFFNHEKKPLLPSEEISTNLKWRQFVLGDQGSKKIKAFFEQIIMLIKNKVLLNGGDLSLTELIWFYPSSMTISRRNNLERLWTDIFKESINTLSPKAISESIAPFYYYNKTQGVIAANKPVLSIDIGGGTTDVVIFKNDGNKNNIPVLQTSFRFAANGIFGDGYGCSPNINGFVKKYNEHIESLLKVNNITGGLMELISTAKNNNSTSEDIISLYFSIDKNINVREKSADISFQKILQNDAEMKIIFLFFYSAIIYHIGKMMKENNIVAPHTVLFSGNGSNLIRILDNSNKFHSLELFTKKIFDLLIAETKENISIKQDENPKEVTAKGGLFESNATLPNTAILVYKGIADKNENEEIKYLDIGKDAVLDGVTKSVEDFIDFFFELNSLFNFEQNFDIPSSKLQGYKEHMRSNIRTHLMSGIDLKLQEIQGNEELNIEETLFFYPLIGIINKLAYEISLNQKNE